VTRALGLAVAVVAVCAAASVARADFPVLPAVAPLPPLDHDGQFGVAARIATGMRFISTYSQSTKCDSAGDQACFAREPTLLEFELSYGLGRHVDLLAEIDLGLEQDFSTTANTDNGPHLVRLDPGLRFWFGESRHTRIFVTAEALFDLSDYRNSSDQSLGNDFGLRSVDGFQYDFNRKFGVYIYGAETVGLVRWLDLELEAGFGMQLRYP
jgi:hypothetical protein